MCEWRRSIPSSSHCVVLPDSHRRAKTMLINIVYTIVTISRLCPWSAGISKCHFNILFVSAFFAITFFAATRGQPFFCKCLILTRCASAFLLINCPSKSDESTANPLRIDWLMHTFPFAANRIEFNAINCTATGNGHFSLFCHKFNFRL